MSIQREKPSISPQQLNVTLGLPVDTPCLVGGGMIENFREGWALNIMPPASVGHYFRRNLKHGQFDIVVAECGYRTGVRWLYGIGNFPKCKRCQKALEHRGKA